MQPDANLARPDPLFWSRGGGGNETHYHLDRRRSPTRTTLGNLRNQEGAIKDLLKSQCLYPNSKIILDNISQIPYNLSMEEII